MGRTNSVRLLEVCPELMQSICSEIVSQFFLKGYDICVDPYASNGKEISITNERIFKRIFGKRTAFKIRLVPCEKGIWFKTAVGMYGHKEIPLPWSIFFVPLTWKLAERYRFEDKALAIVEEVIRESNEQY